MKKIKIDKFSDFSFEIQWNLPFLRNIFIKNIDYLHPKPLFIITLVLLFIISIFKTKVFSIFIPLLVLYIYNYLILKKLKTGLKIRRFFSLKSKENKTEEIKYELSNPYNFDVSNLLIQDTFLGHKSNKNKVEYLFYFQEFKKHLRKIIHKKLSLNNGMGKKDIGPLTFHITDPIGIHHLTYHDDAISNMQVYPHVEKIYAPLTTANEDSIEFGLFDSIKRGENVNFFSTREYRQGDSVKKINWKLSLKTHKLIINEFENNSNSNIDLVLFDDQRLHVGTGKDSSFENCKDIALSLCQKYINANNSIALHTHQKYYPSKVGKSHLLNLELAMSELELAKYHTHDLYHKKNKVPVEILKLHDILKINIKSGNDIFIITGIMPGKVWRYYKEIIKTLAYKSKNVHLIIVNSINVLDLESSDFDQTWISQIKSQIPQEINEVKTLCKQLNIKLKFVNIKANESAKMRMKNVFKQ